MEKIVGVILAGGRGSRMGAEVSKQFIEIDEKPIIYHTIKAFEKCDKISDIILVLPSNEIDYFKEKILNRFDFNISAIVEGGKERQDSVYNALKYIDDCEIVLIHDGARPFVNLNIINKGIEFAKEFGASAPGVMPKDTIKVKNQESFSESTPDRSTLMAIQTPQCFNYKLIRQCHEKVKEQNISVTDDTMVAEMFGNKVYLYEGDYKNIKVTTPEDLILCREFIKQNQDV